MTNSTAQNKLGELFVDIGVGGLGNTLKALNSVSASFLLTKNAAVQMIKPLADMGLKVAKDAVGIGKMAAALGTTEENAYKLRRYLREFSSEDLMGDVANVSQKFTDIFNHQGQIDGLFARSMATMGLNWQNYSGSFEDTLKFIMDVKKQLKTLNLPKNIELMHLRNLGLQKFQYLFEKPDFNIEDAAKILQEDIDKEQALNEAMQNLKNSIDDLKMKVVSKMIDAGLIENIGKIADWTARQVDNVENVSDAIVTVNPTIPTEKKIPQVANTQLNTFGVLGKAIGKIGFDNAEGGEQFFKGLYLMMLGVKRNPQTGDFIYPENFPTDLKNKIEESKNISFNFINNNNITGDNPEEIASAIYNQNILDVTQARIYEKANQAIG